MNSNHNHRRINRETIRLAFQIPGSYDLKPSKIWRIRTQAGVHDFRLEGFFLDDQKTLCRTAVTHVGVGEVVMITFTGTDGIQPAPVGFRINTKGEPVALEDLSAFSVNQIISHSPSIDFDGRGFLHVTMEDLCTFMRARHPRWLQNQVDATLRSWRTEATDLFVRVAPSHWLGKSRGFWRVWIQSRHWRSTTGNLETNSADSASAGLSPTKTRPSTARSHPR
jgi:hypothetical protein